MQAILYAVRVSPPTFARSDDEASLARRVIDATPGRDRAAEEALYRLLAPRAQLYALKQLREPHAAADLAQDAMLLVLDRLRRGEIREPERIASFALGTCRQLAIDRRRAAQRRGRIIEAFAHELEAVILESEQPARSELEQLERCLDNLPERERTVIVMTFFQENSATDVAQALGLSAANARVIRHRAVLRLRSCIDGGAGDE